MIVRMKSTAAGANGLLLAGQVVDVDDVTAIAWLNGGYAEPVAKIVETAVLEPTQKATEYENAAPANSSPKRASHARRGQKSSTR